MLPLDYPLLLALPRDVIQEIDLSVLAKLSIEESQMIKRFSEWLDKYVVVYDTDYKPRKGHLCKKIKSASLNETQIFQLQLFERSLESKNRAIVVYEKPVILI